MTATRIKCVRTLAKRGKGIPPDSTPHERREHEFYFHFPEYLPRFLLPVRRGPCRRVEFNEVSMGDLTVHAEARRARRKPGTATVTADPGRGKRGWNKKTGPGGRRKSLKRLDTDMEIKVNSKENPRIFQAIPRIFQGFSHEIEGFPKMRRTAPAKPGVKGGAVIASAAKRSRRTSGALRSPGSPRRGRGPSRLAMTDRDGPATRASPALNPPSPAAEGMLKSAVLSLVFRSASRPRRSAIFASSPLKSRRDLRYALLGPA